MQGIAASFKYNLRDNMQLSKLQEQNIRAVANIMYASAFGMEHTTIKISSINATYKHNQSPKILTATYVNGQLNRQQLQADAVAAVTELTTNLGVTPLVNALNTINSQHSIEQQTRKLLIVYTDGDPSDDSGYRLPEHDKVQLHITEHGQDKPLFLDSSGHITLECHTQCRANTPLRMDKHLFQALMNKVTHTDAQGNLVQGIDMSTAIIDDDVKWTNAVDAFRFNTDTNDDPVSEAIEIASIQGHLPIIRSLLTSKPYLTDNTAYDNLDERVLSYKEFMDVHNYIPGNQTYQE